MLLWLPIVLLPIVLSVGLAWRRWRNPTWRPLIPGVLATGAGTTFCLVVYRWGFETARCSDRGSVACLLNANQGVISVVALGLAVVGLWGVAINRHFDRRGARNALEHRARTALLAALQETEHNLIHFGLASNLGTNRMVGLPQLSVDETRALCHQDLRAVLHPEVVEAAQNTLRNYEATHVPDDRRSYYHARAFVNTSLRLMVASGLNHAELVGTFFARPGYQDIREILTRGECFIAFHASEAEADAPRLRANDEVLLCWFNDGGPQGVRTRPQCIRFRDMDHAAH